jgi:hypothetical protein
MLDSPHRPTSNLLIHLPSCLSRRSATIVQLAFLLVASAETAHSADVDRTSPTSSPPFTHALLDNALRTWVDSCSRVDYAGLAASRHHLDSYLDSVSAVSPRNEPSRFPSLDHELAYWINAYNAFVLVGIVDAYPVKSVADIGGLEAFFQKRTVVAGGESLTLDQIENTIIRSQFKDPRIHFAANCAAVSCPELEARAFEGLDIAGRLDSALRRFVTDQSHVRIDRNRRRIHLSRIMDWYGGDFTQRIPEQKADRSQNTQLVPKPTVIDYLILHMADEDATYLRQHPDIEIEFNDYDWSLNVQSH